MRFNQPGHGKGPRLPRTGRAALWGSLIGVGIAYSQIFYPSMQGGAAVDPGRGRVAVIDGAPIRVRTMRGESGAEAEARMLWAVRYLMGIAEGRAQ
jgi:hypothetical protein